VLFFAPIVRELESRGAEVLATSRRYREVEPVARLCGLDLKLVGERGGKDLADQLVSSTARQAEIIPMVERFKPGVAVSVASAVCARVAFGLRFPHVAVNDSPHSEVANRLSLPLSMFVLCPWVIPPSAWTRFGLSRSQVIPYHALDPAAWLKRAPLNGPVPKLDRSRRTITIRLEESYAPYMIGSSAKWGDSVLDGVAEAFPECNLVALCRYGDQVRSVQRKFGSKYLVPSDFVDGRRLLESSDLFIGMGGTMSAEAALLGVPTISAFQGSYLIERYLRSLGLLAKASSRRQLLKLARERMKPSFKERCEERARRALSSMVDPVPIVADAVVRAAAQT
jgi:predicted glycosyltransferase